MRREATCWIACDPSGRYWVRCTAGCPVSNTQTFGTYGEAFHAGVQHEHLYHYATPAKHARTG